MISATLPRHLTVEVNHLVTRGRYMIAGCQTFILNRRSNVDQVDESKRSKILSTKKMDEPLLYSISFYNSIIFSLSDCNWQLPGEEQ